MNQTWMICAAGVAAIGLASHASAQPAPAAASSAKGVYKVVQYDPMNTSKVTCSPGDSVVRFDKPVVQGAGPVSGVVFTFGFPDNVEGKVTGVWEEEGLVKLEGDPDNTAMMEETLRSARGRPCT